MATGITGERLLGLWASQANITYNTSSEEDAKGWDSFLEFKMYNGTAIPRDKTFDLIKCFIQVKTTKTDSISANILLSNWENMIKNPLPFFILGIKINEKEIPEKLYLTHIDEVWISKVIKRMREIGNTEPLNKHILNYRPTDSDCIGEISGSAIKEKIISYINGSMKDYVKRKDKWLDTVGYEKRQGQVTFNMVATKDEIIDFSVGLKKNIEISDCIVKSDIRFGIPGNEESFERGVIEIQPTGIDVKVKFSNNFYSIISDGKLYDPIQLFGQIPHEKAKVRIVTQFYDIILTDGSEFSIKIKGDLGNISMDLKTLLEYSRFILILHGIKENGQFEIMLKDLQFNIPISEEIGESVTINISEGILRFAQMFEELNFILNNLNIEPPKNFDIEELFPYRDYIANIRMVLDARFYGNLIMRAKYKEAEYVDNSMLEMLGNKVALPRVLFFKLDKKYVVIYVIYYGVFSENSEGFRQYQMEPRFDLHEIVDDISDIFIEEKTKNLSRKIKPGYLDLMQRQEFIIP